MIKCLDARKSKVRSTWIIQAPIRYFDCTSMFSYSAYTCSSSYWAKIYLVFCCRCWNFNLPTTPVLLRNQRLFNLGGFHFFDVLSFPLFIGKYSIRIFDVLLCVQKVKLSCVNKSWSLYCQTWTSTCQETYSWWTSPCTILYAGSLDISHFPFPFLMIISNHNVYECILFTKGGLEMRRCFEWFWNFTLERFQAPGSNDFNSLHWRVLKFHKTCDAQIPL